VGRSGDLTVLQSGHSTGSGGNHRPNGCGGGGGAKKSEIIFMDFHYWELGIEKKKKKIENNDKKITLKTPILMGKPIRLET